MPDSYIFYISDFSPYIACYCPLLQNFLICDNNKIFCVVFINGKFCKYLALVTINDFSFFGFNVSRNIANKVGSNDTHLIIDKLLGLSIRLDLHLRIHICVSFLFFFFSQPYVLTFQQWTVHPCTVHGSHKLHFSATFSLKMGLTALFTHLKIILL